MLSMREIQQIRTLYFNEGKSITEIKRQTGRDRKTIRQYINNEDWDASPKDKNESLYPKLDQFKPEIDLWLTEDKKAKKKQRHTAKRVYDRLTELHGEAFHCSYRTVAGYVAMKKKQIFKKSEGFLPLEHIPGEAQADFGDAEYYENGRLYGGKYLNLSFPASNMGYMQLFKGENQECLFEGLKLIFEHIGGVPTRIWFDNASTMVKKVLKNGERELTDDFIRFSEHYRFTAAFCNRNAGHEKGNVEGKVGYHRRNMLVPVPRFTNLSDFNKDLLERCEKDALRDHYRKDIPINDLFEQDKVELLSLPKNKLDVSKYLTVKTNNYGRFYLENGLHEYSASPRYASMRIRVKLTANYVYPLDDSLREIVKHERFYEKTKQQSMKWLPYLTQLSRSPGALKYTGIYQMFPESIQQFLEKSDKSKKGEVLKMIASLTAEYGFKQAIITVEQALEYEISDSDSLLSLHKRLHLNREELPPIQIGKNIPKIRSSTQDLSQYDRKLEKMGARI
jgi:transposase